MFISIVDPQTKPNLNTSQLYSHLLSRNFPNSNVLNNVRNNPFPCISHLFSSYLKKIDLKTRNQIKQFSRTFRQSNKFHLPLNIIGLKLSERSQRVDHLKLFFVIRLLVIVDALAIRVYL